MDCHLIRGKDKRPNRAGISCSNSLWKDVGPSDITIRTEGYPNPYHLKYMVILLKTFKHAYIRLDVNRNPHGFNLNIHLAAYVILYTINNRRSNRVYRQYYGKCNVAIHN